MNRTWVRCLTRYRWQASLFSALVLAICSGVGAGGLGSGGRCFFWAARRSRFRFKIRSLFLPSLFLPLPFSLSRQAWIVVGHTEHN